MKADFASRQLPRSLKPFSDLENKSWYDDSASITDFFHSLSVLFPEGEAFFIRAVRRFAKDERVASNPHLAANVHAFVVQEMQHSAEHSSYNKQIALRYNHDVSKIERHVKNLLALPEYDFWPFRGHLCLALTCSLEHLTAILAEMLLGTPEGRYVLNRMSPSHKHIWIWHAIEESEHKAVAYDVYAAVDGSYVTRVYRHFTATIIFLLVMVYLNVLFAIDGGRLFNLYEHWRLLFFLWIYPGVIPKTAISWVKYLKPGFHPMDHDATDMIKHWNEELEKEMRNVK